MLYVGRPARPVRALSDDEYDFFEYTARRYSALAAEYLNQASKPA
jgi:carbonic anhydrase/acetyltransferase-like protein (isoleucine patch superfamily)